MDWSGNWPPPPKKTKQKTTVNMFTIKPIGDIFILCIIILGLLGVFVSVYACLPYVHVGEDRRAHQPYRHRSYWVTHHASVCPQLWYSPTTSTLVQRPCSAGTSSTQLPTPTSPRGSGVSNPPFPTPTTHAQTWAAWLCQKSYDSSSFFAVGFV